MDADRSKLRLEYFPTAEAQRMSRFRIAPGYAERYPHFVKVNNIWHTEITVRLQDWIGQSGGVLHINYDRTLSEFLFTQHDLCMLFMVRFQGVLLDEIYKR